jgi:hypothetical protein
MRYKVRKLRNLRLGLKEAEPAFRNVLVNGRPILESGRPYRNFGRMLPRELAANWLIAAVLDHCTRSDRFHIMSDPADGDGLIFDTITKEALWTEHVMVIDRAPDHGPDDPQAKILKCVSEKNDRGSAYGRARNLIIFLYRSGNPGPWWPNRLARLLPQPLHFDTVWLVGFQHFERADRIYAVTCLDVSQGGHAPIWLVRIDSNFDRRAICDVQAVSGPTHSYWHYNSGILTAYLGTPITIMPPVSAIRTPSLRQMAHFSRHKEM